MTRSIFLVDDRDETYDIYADAEFEDHVCSCLFVRPDWYPKPPPAFKVRLHSTRPIHLNYSSPVFREDYWDVIRKACPRAIATRCSWDMDFNPHKEKAPYFSVLFPPEHEINLRGDKQSSRMCRKCKRRLVNMDEKYAYFRPSQDNFRAWTADHRLFYVDDLVAENIRRLKYEELKLWEYPVYDKPLPGHALPSDKLP